MFNKSLYEELLMSSQYKLIYDTLPNKLRELGYNDINHVGDNLFCIGNVPVMLVAHADIVMTNNEYPQEFIYKDGIVRANQRTLGSDDRNGIYIMLEAIKDLDVKPFLLVTHDEEQGCKGSDEFVTKMPYNEYDICFAIELDRRGSNDLVFYDCSTEQEFVDYCEQATGYKQAHGSFSDICSIMDEWKICAVNMSVGYYNEHTSNEHTVISEMLNTKHTLIHWLNNIDYSTLKQFPYTPKQKSYSSNWDWLFDSYEEGNDLNGYTFYDEEDEDGCVHKDGCAYTTCADCNALIPMIESSYKFGIALCESCQQYYEDIIDKEDRNFYKLF